MKLVLRPVVRMLVGLLTGTSGGNAASASERQLARRAQLFCCDGQATALAGKLLDWLTCYEK